MGRLKGQHFKRTKWLPGAVRYEQIRAQMRAGVQDPAAIARALSLSKEAVVYHAKCMPDVERVKQRVGVVRWRYVLTFRTPSHDAPEALCA